MQSNFSAEKTKVTPEKILIFKFSSSESLFEKIEALYSSPHLRNIKSDLYSLNGAYCLILHLKTHKISAHRGFSGKTRYFYILEYGKSLCKNNAVLKIGKVLAKEP